MDKKVTFLKVAMSDNTDIARRYRPTITPSILYLGLAGANRRVYFSGDNLASNFESWAAEQIKANPA